MYVWQPNNAHHAYDRNENFQNKLTPKAIIPPVLTSKCADNRIPSVAYANLYA